MGEEAIKAGNLRQAYVSNSRFRVSQTIFTTDREKAYAAMATPADRMLATELVKGIDPEKKMAEPPPMVNLWYPETAPGQRVKIKI